MRLGRRVKNPRPRNCNITHLKLKEKNTHRHQTSQYFGTHNISAPNADDSLTDLGTAEADPYTCCSICNSPFEGPFASCLVWAVIAGECKLVIQNGNYMQPNCHAGGKEPATIDVNAKTYPKDVGGLGNCAGAVTVVNA